MAPNTAKDRREVLDYVARPLEGMDTRHFLLERVFDEPLTDRQISYVPEQLSSPEGVEDRMAAIWNGKLRYQQRREAQRGNTTIIDGVNGKPNNIPAVLSASANDAIYMRDRRFDVLYDENHRPIAWSDPILTLEGHAESPDGGLMLRVGTGAQYAYQIGWKNKDIKRAYADAGIEIPSVFGICTYPITTDGKAILTVRGNTTIRAGKRSGVGGIPYDPTETPVQHQVGEMAEEVLVAEGEYKPSDFRFGGIVTSDLSRTLTGWVPVSLSSAELESRIGAALDKGGILPPDVTGIEAVPLDKRGLENYLLFGPDPDNFLGHVFGGLVLLGHSQHGPEWSGPVADELRRQI